MLRGVDWWMATDVSVEHCASIFRVKEPHKTWIWYFGVRSVVDIVATPRAGHPRNCGLIPGRGHGFFSSPNSLNRPWGPPSLLFSGYRVFFPGIKWPGRGVDYPPPSSAEVKESRAVPLFPLGVIKACFGMNFTPFYIIVFVRAECDAFGDYFGPHIKQAEYLVRPPSAVCE
jgi:hypothetical protein